MEYDRLDFSGHAIRRMFERGISRSHIQHVLTSGDVIAEYLDDKPFPSFLVMGYIKDRPLHVVVAISSDDQRAIVVTAYNPDPAIWEEGFRTRRKTT
ncbi:MAG: DUF4258 domain-containing protein [Myxococcota bacterium]|nr:DUF4258 domain-containing protein [Myxococcota bacterium]